MIVASGEGDPNYAVTPCLVVRTVGKGMIAAGLEKEFKEVQYQPAVVGEPP